jgi:predicted nucleic acid-binding protein
VNKALLDTSYLLALELARDQHHKQAIRHWQRIAGSKIQLVVTSFIFAEVVTFLNNRGHHQKAVELGNNLLHAVSVQFIHVDAALLFEGWSYFQRHADKDYSLTDCISFVLMKNSGIKTAFTFDRHFVQAGFQIEPEP